MIKQTYALLFSTCALAFLLVLGAAAPLPAASATGVDDLTANLGGFAQTTGLGASGDTDLKTKIGNIVNIVLGFLGIVAVVYIIAGGFQWMTAGGNDDQIKSARDNIKNAVIGLAIVLLSFIIVNFAVGQLKLATRANPTAQVQSVLTCKNGTPPQTGSTAPGWDLCTPKYQFSCPADQCPN